MKNVRCRLLAATAMTVGLLGASSAGAVTINLNNTGGAEVGTNAYMGFTKAANFWSKVLTNDVTINLNVGFTALDPGVLGSTNSPRVGVYTEDVEFLLNAGKTSALDAQAVANMPTLDAGGSLNVITNGYDNPATKMGVNTSTRVFDTDDSANNFGLAITRANAKALGFTGLTGPDASITFSSSFAFDFDPTNGISDNSYDFIGVAIHEIGHALGFISGVDTYDILGNNGPFSTDDRNFNNFVINSVLDLYRYTSDPTDAAPGAGPSLDWSVGGNPYFSLDKGATVFSLGGQSGYFSTGQFNGDGRQASHWKDNTYAGGATCSNASSTPIGILDPTSGRCEALAVTAMDMAAFDAIGWNTSIDVLTNGGYYASTASVFDGSFGVPEPAIWMQMILGFGLLGSAARFRRRGLAA